MIAEQLSELRKNRKTMLHDLKSTVTFLPDNSLGKSGLLDLIKIDTLYTTNRSLNFERHQLSEKEEQKFNKKFAPFLKSLIVHMNSESIDFLLEYLVKVYCIDTYNTKELMFLLLPFKKYFNQIKIVSKNSRFKFDSWNSYSILGLAKIIAKDTNLFYMFVEYFEYYETLKEFLDKLTDEIIEILKNSNLDYCSEFYQIFIYLTKSGHHNKALEIYHRMRTYLDSDDFIKILLPFFSEDVIKMKEDKLVAVSIFEKAFENSSGRAFLSNEGELIEYLKFLDKSKFIPREFTDLEFKLLKNIYLGTENTVKISNIEEVKKLYIELGSKLKLTMLLFGKYDISPLFPYMSIEDALYVVNNSDEYFENLINEQNHQILIKNLKPPVFKANYNSILRKCLEYVSFEPKLFSEYVSFDTVSDISKYNLLKLAKSTNFPIIPHLLKEKYNDVIYLRYILASDYAFDTEQVNFIINLIHTKADASLYSETAEFLHRRFDKQTAIDFIQHAYKHGFLSCCAVLIDRRDMCSVLPVEILFNFYIYSESDIVLEELLRRDNDFISKIYDKKSFHLIYNIAKNHSLQRVLIPVDEVSVFIEKYHHKFEDKKPFADFILNNFSIHSISSFLVYFYEYLIEFREHSCWNIAKKLIIDEMENRKCHQIFFNYIINHIELFKNDRDLFLSILNCKPFVTPENLISISTKGSKPAADLVDLIFDKNLVEVIPTIPVISPLLIKYNKPSIKVLFEKFSNLMGIYSKNILKEYPSMVDLLIHVDPRHSLPACASIYSSNENIGEDLIFNINRVMITIFHKYVTSSSELIRKVSEALSNINPDLELIRAFIFFYIKSFKDVFDKNISKFLLKSFIECREIFDEIIDEFADKNYLIFSDVLSQSIVNIKNGSSQDLYLLSKCVHAPILDENESIELCKIIFKQNHSNSAIAISAVLKANPSLINTVHPFIESKLLTNTLFCIDVLKYLFSNVPEYQEHRSGILPKISLLAESNNVEISQKAKELYEILQFK